MIKISTPTKEQELYELAQEAPYPMTKRALDALKNGKQDEAMQILEELLISIESKHKHFLWHNLYQLTYRVILWKQLPQNEREGVWLTEIDKYREEIALLLYKNPNLALILEKNLSQAIEDAMDTAKIDIKNQEIFAPSREDIFETEHHWKTLNPQNHG